MRGQINALVAGVLGPIGLFLILKARTAYSAAVTRVVAQEGAGAV